MALGVGSVMDDSHSGHTFVDFLARRCAPLTTLIPLLLVVTCIELPLILYEFSTDLNIASTSRGFSVVQILLKVSSIFVLAYHCLRRYRQQLRNEPPVFKTYSLSHLLQLSFCSLYTFGTIFNFISQVIVTVAGDFNTHDPGSGINWATYSLMITPLLLGVIFSDALRDVISVWWMLCMLCLVVAAIVLNNFLYGFGVGYYFLQSTLIFYSMQQNAWLAYLKQQVQHKRQEEALEAQDTNMKHMMANVAHDLKTPLSSIMSGIDLINDMTAEALLGVEKGIVNLRYLRTMLKSARECVQNISSTNHFMIMTINRCIQYTKASQGLTLTPSLETIDLEETLKLPLRCMKDVQDRVQITMSAIPYNLCKFIITDKQWLQENILCLLSNAVKYSYAGTVNVSMHLEALKRKSRGGSIISSIFRASECSEAFFENSLNRQASPVHKVHPSPEDQPNKSWGNFLKGQKLRNHSVVPWNYLERENSLDRPIDRNRSLEAEQKICDRLLRIEVEDQGIGMSDEAMQKLFTPFQQDQTLAIGSTGLGLFSLRKRVEALGGECGVSARHDRGQGSLFWFTIPYRPDHVHEELAEVHEEGECEAEYMNGSDDGSTQKLQVQSNKSGVTVVRTLSAMVDDDNSTVHGRFLPNTLSQETLQTFTQPTFTSFNQASSVTPVDFYSSIDTEEQKTTLTAPPTTTLIFANPAPSTDRTMRVLLVDDSASILKMTKMLLHRHHYDVTTAANGAMALDIIRAEQKKTGLVVVFDVILMDLQMPVMDGLEAMRRLRMLENECIEHDIEVGNEGSKRTHRHYIFGLSANYHKDINMKLKAAGCDCFLSKPFQLQAFSTILQDKGYI